MGSAENGGGQHPAPEGRKIGTPSPLWMFLTASLSSQKFKFLDPCMTAEKCVAKNANFWTHALKQRNV